eukprot:1161213-Pelagomonas_calceolata.AAC.6
MLQLPQCSQSSRHADEWLAYLCLLYLQGYARDFLTNETVRDAFINDPTLRNASRPFLKLQGDELRFLFRRCVCYCDSFSVAAPFVWADALDNTLTFSPASCPAFLCSSLKQRQCCIHSALY